MTLRQVKVSIFILCLLPAAWLVWSLITNQLGANPIEALTRSSGLWALRFLWITLAISPLQLLFKWPFLIAIRRMLGLYTFFYATIHMLLYLWLDQFFDVNEIIQDIIKRPFITIGFFSYSALIALAVTSNDAMVMKLGPLRWKRLHRLVYYIAMASALHFYMLVKQDKSEPLIYIVLLAILLGTRLYRYSKRQFA